MHNLNQAKQNNRIINVLFVDDDSSFLASTKILLERIGYIVTSAKGSSEALALMKEFNDVFNDAFDIIITDYSMPELSGVEFAKIASNSLVDIPIILYTGNVDLIDKKQITEAGIAEIVTKPCSISKLDSIIKSLISEKPKRRWELEKPLNTSMNKGFRQGL